MDEGLLTRVAERRARLNSSLIESHRDLIENLKTIPHLRLDLQFDLETLRKEVATVDHFVPHQVEEFRGQQFVQHYKESWHGRSLIDYTPDSYLGMTQTGAFPSSKKTFNSDGSTRMFVTDLGEQLPYSVQCVHEISHYPGRTRLAKILAGKSMIWHTHCQLKTYAPVPYVFGIVHIPIFSNPHVSYEVAPVGSHEPGQPVWKEHYRPGEVWLFNGWHDHRVVNNGAEDRISIVSYCHLIDPHFREIVQKAVDAYDGPRIP